MAALLLALASAHAAAQPAAPAKAEPATAETRIQRLDASATLASSQAVQIDNPYGDVRLRFGGYQHAIEAHAVIQQPDGAAEIEFKPATVDGQFRIAPRLPAGRQLVDGQRMDLVVFVAEGHSVSVRNESGLIESRGIRADINLHSTSGNIAVRGTQGTVQARTGAGSIEASLGRAPSGSSQRLATSTGMIVVAVHDDLDARLELTSSAAFATEFTLQVESLPGQEPNKKAIAVIGEEEANIYLESRRGEIRLLRWSGFTSVDGDPVEEEEEESDSD